MTQFLFSLRSLCCVAMAHAFPAFSVMPTRISDNFLAALPFGEDIPVRLTRAHVINPHPQLCPIPIPVQEPPCDRLTARLVAHP